MNRVPIGIYNYATSEGQLEQSNFLEQITKLWNKSIIKLPLLTLAFVSGVGFEISRAVEEI